MRYLFPTIEPGTSRVLPGIVSGALMIGLGRVLAMVSASPCRSPQ
jgi:hypothetical protein